MKFKPGNGVNFRGNIFYSEVDSQLRLMVNFQESKPDRNERAKVATDRVKLVPR